MISAVDIRNAVTVVLAAVGALFFLIGTIGLVRLPDFYARTHAATKCDTVGAGSLLLALAVFNGVDVSTLKIIALAGLVLLSSPTIGHALARAAHRTGVAPWQARKGRTS
ncbi:MAG: monovalent cation/H(+) antiporter subunit G [Anaerosomatales bacterium]|nr:monovalent cation/H(+) antiporter subunit G [Anaerosomatales bacterium]MDT8434003.1 monovalent cation/H(+) antiporter subunit G [Anaerosomatales bacterium]